MWLPSTIYSDFVVLVRWDKNFRCSPCRWNMTRCLSSNRDRGSGPCVNARRTRCGKCNASRGESGNRRDRPNAPSICGPLHAIRLLFFCVGVFLSPFRVTRVSRPMTNRTSNGVTNNNNNCASRQIWTRQACANYRCNLQARKRGASNCGET